jgi:acyl-CoA thioester hydrolase
VFHELVDPFQMRAEMAFTIRPYDIDFGGVVGNSVYIRWMDDLRYRLLDLHLPVEEFVDAGMGIMVHETWSGTAGPCSRRF